MLSLATRPQLPCAPHMRPHTRRHSSQFSTSSLFRSSDEDVPYEHRSSVVEGVPNELKATSTSMTEALLAAHPNDFKAATQAPFLELAGSGKLSKKMLSRWLSQDRLYAETYICFVSSLIARVNLPHTFVSDRSKSLRWRILNMLIGALQNIQQELDFFTSTADEYDLDLSHSPDEGQHMGPEVATKQYMELFRSFFNDPTLPLIEGLIVLWATEQCYLSAWTFASKFCDSSVSTGSDADGGALREKFIPNWTSSEFVSFVDEIAELTNLLAYRENAGRKLEVYKAVWLHVLDIEKRFWPRVDK